MFNSVKFILILTAVVSLIFVSCQRNEADPQIFSEKITKENLISLVKQVSEDKTVSKEKMDLVTTGITRLATLKRDTVLGMTFSQIRQIQEEFIREQSAATLRAQGARVDLVLNHEFKFLGLIPRDTNGKSFNILAIEFKNTSEKEITNIQGSLQFFDQNNQIVKNFPIIAKNVLNGQKIPAGKELRLAYPFNHEPNNVRDAMMRDDIKSMRSVWVATMIEFADGTQISVQAANQ